MFRRNIFQSIDSAKCNYIDAFAEDYMQFLRSAKTERLAVKKIEKIATDNGFKNINQVDHLSAGDKVYFKNRDKNIVLFVIGKCFLDGLRILGAHVDSPRLDLKQCPVIDSEGFTLFDTHYYGSLKNYQYVATPLEIHGVVCRPDGSVIELSIGDKEDDPVLGISDLLIHLSHDQMQKNGYKIIDGEEMDVIIGTLPYRIDEGASYNYSWQCLSSLIESKYGISEEDFISAELEIVPATPVRDFGLDRTMIAGYGHDDRASVYATLMALINVLDPTETSCAVFVDKEEVGSVGSTSVSSVFFENCVIELLSKCNRNTLTDLYDTFKNSYMISCDVFPALDPIYGGVSDKNNCARFNHGVVLAKHLDGGGKFGTNDASPEYIAKLIGVINSENIHYQTAEFARVDQGGGGSISFIPAKYNMEVIDCGIPVLNMHSPMEIIAKADLYEAYLFYKSFLTQI